MNILNKPISYKNILFIPFFIITALSIGFASTQTSIVNYLNFLVLFFLLLAITLRFKYNVFPVLVIYLIFLGLIRRLLIPVTGWPEYDLLLIVVPLITLILFIYTLFNRKYVNVFQKNLLTKIMYIILLVGVLQIFNPLGGSLLSGIMGSIFLIIPWCWYFISYYYFDEQKILKVFKIIEIIGFSVACYGLYQTFYGYLPFEKVWFDIAGYQALYIGQSLRAIGTFPSAMEYTVFCMITFIISFSHLILKSKLKYFHILTCIVSFMAIIFESTRTIIITTIFASISMYIFSKNKKSTKLIITFFAFILLVFFVNSLRYIPTQIFGDQANNIEHIISGLTNPLAEDDTGSLHIERVFSGIITPLKNPVGYGLGTITTGATKSGSNLSTEFDISNILVGFGLIGFIYLIAYILVFRNALKYINLKKDTISLAIFGILIGGIGQWSGGGTYLVSIIFWTLIGFISKQDIGKKETNDVKS
ncbi:hypothetical protein [Neobacillus cucumis]|uniref:O-antigen ligase domain-containing protein n=1 Tax=Neobacillus cucumis TaxID=1740721 RepID=A0A2N5H7L2_9BACI|nr:hypothetical protein [Neobacillus cucumis]PLS01509.1 hypothetical protein CVD27_24960 [Neobacillus cucumis]